MEYGDLVNFDPPDGISMGHYGLFQMLRGEKHRSGVGVGMHADHLFGKEIFIQQHLHGTAAVVENAKGSDLPL